MTWTITCENQHPEVTVATLTETDHGIDAEPGRCDMTRRREPVDGYRFACPICPQHASAHRGDLLRALLQLRAHKGVESISIRGINYLRRLVEDPVRSPQGFDLLAAMTFERSV